MTWQQTLQTIARKFVRPDVVVAIAPEASVAEGNIPHGDLEHITCETCLMLIHANRWVTSRIKYTQDMALTGQWEYWQTPEETLNNRRGDCEDMSFLLASILATYHVPMRIAYGYLGTQLHVWVEAQGGDDRPWLILDPAHGSFDAMENGAYPEPYRKIMYLYESG